MSVSLDLDNDELAYLFFYLQLKEEEGGNPVVETLLEKIEGLVYSRFSISEIESYREKIFNN